MVEYSGYCGPRYCGHHCSTHLDYLPTPITYSIELTDSPYRGEVRVKWLWRIIFIASSVFCRTNHFFEIICLGMLKVVL